MASVTATTYRSRAMCVVYTESHFAPGHDSRLPVHTNVVGAEKRAAIAVRHAGCSARQAGVSALWAGDARTGLPPRSRAGKQPTRQEDRKTHPSDQTLCIHSRAEQQCSGRTPHLQGGSVSLLLRAPRPARITGALTWTAACLPYACAATQRPLPDATEHAWKQLRARYA
jgi:hypothetical protein